MIRQVDSMAITEPIIGQQVGPMTVGTSKINMWGKPAEPPTNVGDIQPTPEVTLNEPPVSAPDISSVSGYMAGKKEDVDLFEAEQLRRQKEIESQQKTDGGILGFLKGAQGKVDESIAEATRESDLAEYNKEKRIKLAEYAKLEEQYNKLEQEKNEAIARIEDNAGGLLDRAVNQEIARIERNYAIRQGTISANMKAKAAYLEVIDGGIENAMQYIDQATKDATRALEFEVDAYKLMSEENEKIKEYLDEPMVAAFEAKVKEKEDELAFQREIEKTKIIESIKSAYDRTGGITPYQLISTQNQIEDNMRLNPAIKGYGELVMSGIPTVIERFESGDVSNISDTVLMRALAKITDPTTGVREEEYRTFEDAVGAINKVYTLPNKWVGRGRLTPLGREQMIKEIKDRYDSRLIDYANEYDYYANRAAQYGISVPPPYQVSGISQKQSSGTTPSGIQYTIEQ